MKCFTALLLAALMMGGCNGKEKKPEVPAASFFPVKDYLSGQVAALDTSTKAFTKIETVDGRSDTTTIRGKDVRKFAQPFLELPDIAAPAIKNDYEISHLYDDLQEAFIFSFTTKEDHPVRQENITVEPELNAAGKNDIRSVFADVWLDGGVRRNMLWEADKSFQVTTSTDAPNGNTSVRRVKVIWNGTDTTKQK